MHLQHARGRRIGTRLGWHEFAIPKTPAFRCLRIDVLVVAAHSVEVPALLTDEIPLIRIGTYRGDVLIVTDVDQVLPTHGAIGRGLDDVVHDVVVDVQRAFLLAAGEGRQLIASLYTGTRIAVEHTIRRK